MTDIEAKGFIQGKLDCMKKCDIFNKEDNTSDNDCDNCEYCYSQGNFGEQKEAFKMAINALEKQIPKKPIIQKTDEKSLYKCPCCTKIFVEAYENTQRGYIPKFCEMCGQSINFRLGR